MPELARRHLRGRSPQGRETSSQCLPAQRLLRGSPRESDWADEHGSLHFDFMRDLIVDLGMQIFVIAINSLSEGSVHTVKTLAWKNAKLEEKRPSG